jgi:hypothetical protein
MEGRQGGRARSFRGINTLVFYLGPMQCCGSVIFSYGSGSADPYVWLTDPDPGRKTYPIAVSSPHLMQPEFKSLIFFTMFIAQSNYLYRVRTIN